MVRVGMIVEGLTELEFVNYVLAPHLIAKDMYIFPKTIGKGGGNVTLNQLSKDMSSFYWKYDFVTALVDFYGFRGKQDREPDELLDAILHAIQERIGARWDKRKVIPYVQVHEFEALLFSDVNAFSAIPAISQAEIDELYTVKSQFLDPEKINDDFFTAPSKRIQKIYNDYNKPNHGRRVAETIGIDKMREQCPRFNEWLEQLEALGS